MDKLKKLTSQKEKVDNQRPSESRRLVPALSRTIQIMDLISSSDERLTISEISRRVGIPKSTAYGICATLVEHEMLMRRDDQSFRIGPHVMRWSNAFSRSIDVMDEFIAIWDSDSDFPGATITLSVRDGADVVYLAVRNSEKYQGFFSFSVGARLPAAFTATGKAFLMHMRESDVRRLYADGLPEPLTPASVQSLDALMEELNQFKKLGYSIDNEQVSDGMRCYAKIVLDSQNMPVAGIAASIPADALTSEEERKIVTSLEAMAEKISRRMGADIRAIQTSSR
jgi:DNA-binding IclR family transcriptional regulator